MPLTPYTDGRNPPPSTPRPAPTPFPPDPLRPLETDVSCGCWRCMGTPDDGTLHAEVGWTPEDRKALDSGAWLGLAILALVALVAFGAGYWMGGMR